MTDALHLDVKLRLEGYALSAKVDIPLTGITALEGPSGSGKTSLLRVIAGLERSAEGLVRFGNEIWLSEQEFMPAQKRRIGYVFQDTRLFEHMDVAQNLAYGHKRAGAGAGVLARVIEALDLSPLLKRRIGGLSGGEKQRVAIGRALASDPQLLLMDEPMSGLDQGRKAEILPYIARGVQVSGCPAIYVSHDRRETAMLADRVLQVADGQVNGPFAYKTRLTGELRQAKHDGVLRLYVGNHETSLPVQGVVGDRFGIRVNEASVVLAKQDPGQSSALVCMPATLGAILPHGDGTCQMVLDGDCWQIEISRTVDEVEALKLTVGLTLWMVITEAAAYPEAGGTV